MKHAITGTDDAGDRIEVAVENNPVIPGAVELTVAPTENVEVAYPVTVERDELRTALFLLDKEEAGDL